MSHSSMVRRQVRRQTRLFRPHLELLEARHAPAAIRPGFNTTSYGRTDDGAYSGGAQNLGFTINYFSNTHTTVFVNNNGNLTFDAALGTYTPFDLTSTSREIVAPFFADVDSSAAGNETKFGAGTVNGHVAFGVTWVDVDYFSSSVSHTNRNSFQALLIDRSDIAPGDFDIEFNYDQIEWEAGEASGSDSNGLGGSTARMGFSNGTGNPGTFYELTGSAIRGAFLDNNLSTGLIHHSLNSSVLGRYLFFARNGLIQVTGINIAESGGSTSVGEASGSDTYNVFLSSPPTGNVTITLAPNAQVTAVPTSLVFTSLNWNTPQTVTVTSAGDDLIAQGNRTVPVTHTSTSTDPNYDNIAGIGTVNVQIIDNERLAIDVVESGGSTAAVENGATDTYTVVLGSQPTADVVITLNPGTQLTVSPSTLTFTASNWNTPRTVTVTAINDGVLEGPHTGTIAHTVSTSDSAYAAITIPNITVDITDNPFGVIVTQSGGSTDAAEGGATDSFDVVLIGDPSASVTINLNPGSQVTLSRTSLVFTPANWNVPQAVTVTAVDDAAIEGNHTGVISYSVVSSDTDYNGLAVSNTTVNITDNDFPGVILSPASGLAILEGLSRPYTAVLNTTPTANVTVNVSPNAQLSFVPTTLVFTPANWNIPQTVTATARDNTLSDGNRTVAIDHTTSSSDSRFDSVTVTPLPVQIIDDDTLIVRGTEKSDQIGVLFGPNQIQVVINGRASFYKPTAAAGVLIIAGNGINTVRLVNPTLPVTLLGGTATDNLFIDGQLVANTFDIDSSSVTYNGRSMFLFDTDKLTLTGKTGADTFTVRNVPPIPISLLGAGGQDRLIAPDRANSWKITSNDAGTLDSTIAFTFIENLVGNTGDDTFTFAAGKLVNGQIDGGAGNNTVDLSAYKTPITLNLQPAIPTLTGTKGFRNVDTVVGGAGMMDKLIAGNRSNAWALAGVDAGDVSGLAFRGFENLTGGTLDDTFTLTQGVTLRGKLDAGLGADVLDFSGFTTAATVNLQTKVATGLVGYLNVESFRGGAGADTLIGANRVNVWKLNATGAGTVSGSGFMSFENLTGGVMADMFDLAGGGDWQGLLDGGSGSDILTAPGGSYVITGPNAGTLDGHSFRNVETRRS